jgi:hypothetical protein
MIEPPPESSAADGTQPGVEGMAAETKRTSTRLTKIREFLFRKHILFEPEDEGPGMGRRQAAVGGVQAAVLRVALAIGILIGGFVFAVKSNRIYELLPELKYLPRDELPEYLRWGIFPLAWVAAAGITIMVTISDDDGKWWQLNWSVFSLLASGALIPSGPWYGPVSVAAGLFGLHYAIHLCIKSNDRARHWLWEQERLEREQLKDEELPGSRPKLLDRYSGVAGFEHGE